MTKWKRRNFCRKHTHFVLYCRKMIPTGDWTVWSRAAPLLFSCSGREKFHRHHLTSQPLQPLLPPPPPHDQQHHKEHQDPNQDTGDGHQHLQPFVGSQAFLTLHNRLNERRDCTWKQGHGIRGLLTRTKDWVLREWGTLFLQLQAEHSQGSFCLGWMLHLCV